MLSACAAVTPIPLWPRNASLNNDIDPMSEPVAFRATPCRSVYRRGGKRGFDLVAGVILLAAALVPLLVLCILTMVFDRHAPIFRQVRVGRDARPFRILKLRTMRRDRAVVEAGFEAGKTTRVTRWGQWLRSSKLDELPQLFNVLLGDMSLVGPRPEVPQWVRCWPKRWGYVLTVRPGLTDRASLTFKDEGRLLAAAPDADRHYREVVLPRKLTLYEEYVAGLTFAGDLRLLMRTVLVAFGQLAPERE